MKRVQGITAALAAAFCVCLGSCRPVEGSRAEDKHPAPPYAGVTVRPAEDAAVAAVVSHAAALRLRCHSSCR